MNPKLIILPEATQDFKDAFDWYKIIKVPGLSKRFSDSVKQAIFDLQKQPTAYAIRYKNVRIIHTRVFPYGIHFFVTDNSIVISAILHNSRNPQIPQNRT